jgi:hypothetical protein
MKYLQTPLVVLPHQNPSDAVTELAKDCFKQDISMYYMKHFKKNGVWLLWCLDSFLKMSVLVVAQPRPYMIPGNHTSEPWVWFLVKAWISAVFCVVLLTVKALWWADPTSVGSYHRSEQYLEMSNTANQGSSCFFLMALQPQLGPRPTSVKLSVFTSVF